jgi:hypothetical protein
LTGTPLDLTPFGSLLKSLGYLYWLVALAIVLLALWWPKRWWLKLTSAAIVSVVVMYPVFVSPIEKHIEVANEERLRFKERLSAAAAHFEMRCRSAGERITRTVDNVDGVMWMKWRGEAFDESDQFTPEDPYGRGCGGEACIAGLLFEYRMVPGAGGLVPSRRRMYSYVEAIGPVDGRTYRYRKASADAQLEREQVASRLAQYGVEWVDVSTPEDRQHWVAGGALRIVDLRTNEVVAERIGYLMDRGLGDRAGSRTPWSWARSHGPACPPIQDHNLPFITKVLNPSLRGK